MRGPLPLSSSSSSSSDLTRVAVKVLEVDASEAAKYVIPSPFFSHLLTIKYIFREKMIDIQKEFYLEVYTMAVCFLLYIYIKEESIYLFLFSE